MPASESVFLVHLAATLFMTGVIWFVQVVHYPMFSTVGRRAFADYTVEHQRRTGWVVAPPMIVEALTGIALVLRPPSEASRGVLVAALVMLAIIWASTALLQVPAHRRLSTGWDERSHRSLVSTNLIRTALWSARSILLLVAAGPLATPHGGVS
jgi:uncharacterized membrane protein